MGIRSIRRDRLAQLATTSRIGFAMITTVLVLFGVMRLVQATPYGLGLNGDSFYYITGAETMALGLGFGRLSGGGDFIPTTHYPPSYSATMAGLQLLGVDKLDSARLIAVVSFVVLISVVAMMLRREAGSNIPAFVTSAILVTSPVMLNLYAWVMSEALYLALAFMALYLLWNSENQRRTLLVLAAAILCGLALLTRYVGIALAATGLVLIVLAKTSARRKLAEASLLLGIGALPMLGWIVRNAQLTGNLANRNVLWHPVGLEHLEQLALHVLDWFVPAQILARRLPLTGLIPLLGLIVGVVLLVLAKQTQPLRQIGQTRLLREQILGLKQHQYAAFRAQPVSQLLKVGLVGGPLCSGIQVNSPGYRVGVSISPKVEPGHAVRSDGD